MLSIEDALNNINLVSIDREGRQGEYKADLALAPIIIRSSIAI